MDHNKKKKAKKSSKNERHNLQQYVMDPKTINFIAELTLNNPGSVVAVEAMYNHNPTRALKLYNEMKNFGMTGSKIWVGYKFYERNVENFMRGIEIRDLMMIEYINNTIRSGGCGNIEEIIF